MSFNVFNLSQTVRLKSSTSKQALIIINLKTSYLYVDKKCIYLLPMSISQYIGLNTKGIRCSIYVRKVLAQMSLKLSLNS